MIRSLHGFLLGLLVASSGAVAEGMLIDGRAFALKAQARACYLGFIELYDVDYLRSETQPASCIRLSYLRDFDAAALGEATRKVFEDRHGEPAMRRYRVELEEVARAYRSVVPGDQYLYCVDAAGGTLLRDGSPAVRLPDSGFARRFMQIWVKAGRVGREPEWGFGRC